MEFRIININNLAKSFYTMMGPFLARREIAKALGEPLWDDDGAEWFVALDGIGRVLGFAAVRRGKNHVEFGSCYVLPEYRKQGIATALVDTRLAKYKNNIVKVVTNKHSVKCYANKGFITERETTNYSFMTRVSE